LKQQKPALKVLLLEKEKQLAQHQTGHNSGVIHSGIYYKPNSLKAQNCLRGYRQLLDFCQTHQITHEICGKVIIATDEKELPALENVFQRGQENGLEGLKKLNAEQIKEHEPHVTGIQGIFVPQTGIVDYMQVSLKYAELFSQLGGEIHTNEKVLDIASNKAKPEVFTTKTSYQAQLVINCAGLYSDKIASFTVKNLDTRIIPFRGEYFELKPEKQYLVKHLIYPVPDPSFPFLGVHFTRMIGGGIEAGPNAVFAFRKEGYTRTSINLQELWGSVAWRGFRKVAAKYWRTGLGEMYRSFSKAAFTKALQRLIPEVQEDDLVPAGAGVRAQACDKTGGLLDDFKIIEDGLAIHVLNAPSPAATSSLSIGQSVAEMALKRF
ncbi:MAG: L-2-hydroxyglutarate oxidase, partial [Bacteroidetes bacterium]